ncbi:Senescence regulator S40 [Macleaya cordata]|uniref:Senescence regulator S40 n=1 Tax=Macleaya cordata TaxID=56857 RepID=A0A200Q815_MACCD|nr:Senescence regulator S40 [Macleaya cordata]
MAKGRKNGSNRQERFLGSYGYNQNQGTGADGSELGEEDVWSMVDDAADDQVRHVATNEWSYGGSQSNGDRRIRNGRWFGREDHRQVGGLSLAFENSGKTPSSRIVHQFHGQDNMATGNQRGHHMAASAPVNVPDWTKILRVNSVESLQDSDDGYDDDDSERVPPHEYLARGSRRMTTTSVFEGVGRTLKGRDMSRVRDAVWSQTGFDG